MMAVILALQLAIAQQAVPPAPAVPQNGWPWSRQGNSHSAARRAEAGRTGQDQGEDRTDRSPGEGPEGQARQARNWWAMSRSMRKAGRMLLEFPDMFGTQAAIDHSFTVLDQGIERGKQLQTNQPQWNQGKKQIHAYYSEIDGAVLPYGVTLPENYDPTKPTRLYVWLHGRQNNTTEAEFIYGFLNRRPPGNAPVADQGQIQLDCFGRINGAGWHWAGEMDVFESIAAVKKRFNIDDKRIILRGFSQGGEGAWHISLHHPDRFAAAEIGAGTVSRTRPAARPAALSTCDAAHLGEHLRVGAQHLQSAARRARRRERSRSTGILASRPRATGEGRLPVRRRSRLPPLQRRARPVDGFQGHRSRHQPAGSPAARRLSQGMGRQRPDLARPHPLPDLHHALQPRLLGFPRRPGKALRTRRSGRAAHRRRRILRHQNEEPHPAGSARNRARQGDQDRRPDSESEGRPGDHARPERLGLESGQERHASPACTRRTRCKARSTTRSSIRSCWSAPPARPGTKK